MPDLACDAAFAAAGFESPYSTAKDAAGIIHLVNPPEVVGVSLQGAGRIGCLCLSSAIQRRCRVGIQDAVVLCPEVHIIMHRSCSHGPAQPWREDDIACLIERIRAFGRSAADDVAYLLFSQGNPVYPNIIQTAFIAAFSCTAVIITPDGRRTVKRFGRMRGIIDGFIQSRAVGSINGCPGGFDDQCHKSPLAGGRTQVGIPAVIAVIPVIAKGVIAFIIEVGRAGITV